MGRLITGLSAGYLIPYPDAVGYLPFSRVRLDVPYKEKDVSNESGLYSKKQKEAKYLSRLGIPINLYIPRKVWPILENDRPLFFTEGEKKALKASAEGFPTIGLPGVYGYSRDKKLLPDFDNINFENRVVYIVFDGDKRRNSNVLNAEKSFATALSRRNAKVKIVDLPEDQKLDDFLVAFGNEAFQKLVDGANDFVSKPEPTHIQCEIVQIRKSKVKVFEQRSKIAQLIVDDLSKNGVFIKSNLEPLYFSRITKKVCSLKDKEFNALLNSEYQINTSEMEHKYLIAELEAYTLNGGNVVNPYRFAHFDRKERKLYISRFDGAVYLLDGVKVEKVDNGTNGIFFVDDASWQPFEYLNEQIPLDIFSNILVNKVNFDVIGGQEALSKKRKLLFIYILALFFSELLPTKPLLLFLGEKGSGKTMSLKIINHWLFGENARVLSIAKGKEDAFLATVSNGHFIVFDNVDGKIDWLNDHLAAVSTNAGVSLRELYSTNNVITFKPRVFIAMTSRTPKFKRDDVVDRLLIFPVKRIENFQSEESILNQVINKRNALWTAGINLINQIIHNIDFEKKISAGNCRMADFAVFGQRVFSALGKEQDFFEIVQNLVMEQSHFLFEDDVFFQALTIWINNPQNRRRQVLTATLFRELESIASFNKLVWSYPSVIGFGMRLKNVLPALRNYYDIEVIEGRSNQTEYVFNFKSG